MIYVASPFWHEDSETRDWRRNQAIDYSKKLFLAGVPNYTPLVYSYLFKDNNAKEKYWIEHGLKMIDACTSLHVLCLPDWEQSSGIRGEVERAEKKGVPVVYIHKHKRLCVLGSRSIAGKEARRFIKKQVELHQSAIVVTAGEPEGICAETIASCRRTSVSLLLCHLNPAKMQGMFEHRTVACLSNSDYAIFIHDGKSSGAQNECIMAHKMGVPFSYYLHKDGEFTLCDPPFIDTEESEPSKQSKGVLDTPDFDFSTIPDFDFSTILSHTPHVR